MSRMAVIMITSYVLLGLVIFASGLQRHQRRFDPYPPGVAIATLILFVVAWPILLVMMKLRKPMVAPRPVTERERGRWQP